MSKINYLTYALMACLALPVWPSYAQSYSLPQSAKPKFDIRLSLEEDPLKDYSKTILAPKDKEKERARKWARTNEGDIVGKVAEGVYSFDHSLGDFYRENTSFLNDYVHESSLSLLEGLHVGVFRLRQVGPLHDFRFDIRASANGSFNNDRKGDTANNGIVGASFSLKLGRGK